MKKEPKRKQLSELNLTDRFLFDEVTEDPAIHQEILSIIFGRDIPILSKNETEKELRVSPHIRSVRMDVFSMDEEQTVYNTEMQDKKKSDLAKRSRYYQSLLDTSLLEPGIPNYNLLNATYIILTMTFDLFGYGKYRYTFEARCREVTDCVLEDKAVRIFLNTKGTNDSEVSEELVAFLHYLEHTTDAMAESSGSERIRRIHNRVCKVKASEEVGVKYMQAWEEKYYEREEGREEGRKEGLKEGRREGLEEGREEGRKSVLQELIKKKMARGKSVELIAQELEESPEVIQKMIDEM